MSFALSQTSRPSGHWLLGRAQVVLALAAIFVQGVSSLRQQSFGMNDVVIPTTGFAEVKTTLQAESLNPPASAVRSAIPVGHEVGVQAPFGDIGHQRLDIEIPAVSLRGGDDTDLWDLFLFDDFENGAGTWSVSHITTCGGVTTLGGYHSTKGIQGEVYTQISALPRHQHVRIRAEIFFIDDWKSEMVYCKIDDRAVWSATCLQCGKKGRHFCGNPRYMDTLADIMDVTLPHKSELVRITFGSNSMRGSDIMSYGIANIMVWIKDSNSVAKTTLTKQEAAVLEAPGDFVQYGNQGNLMGCGKHAAQRTEIRKQPFVAYFPDLGNVPILGSRQKPAQSCDAIASSDLRNKADGIYWIDPEQDNANTAFQVYCDLTGNDGGWTLLLAYRHAPMTVQPVNGHKLPLDPENGYSHSTIEKLGFEKDMFSTLRFYCKTDNHNRIIDFTTMNEGIVETGWDGNQNHFKPKDWHDFRVRPAHSARLPDLTNASFQMRGGHFTDMPFYQLGFYHWSIQGGPLKMRWECDDMTGNNLHDTLHQVWFK